MPLDSGSSLLTCFITPFGRFAFDRLPFGVTVGPEVFQQGFDELWREHPECVAYIDAIVVCDRDQQEHDSNLQKVTQTGFVRSQFEQTQMRL